MNRTDLVWCACVVRKGLTIHCGSWGLSCCLLSRAGGNRIRVPNFRRNCDLHWETPENSWTRGVGFRYIWYLFLGEQYWRRGNNPQESGSKISFGSHESSTFLVETVSNFFLETKLRTSNTGPCRFSREDWLLCGLFFV